MKIEDHLEALSRLRENSSSHAAQAEIRKYLASKSNLVVAKAAKVVAECEIGGMCPPLVEAFDRYMRNPISTDKGCLAKTQIIETLYALDAAEAAVFLAGIRHVQMEPSFGPPVDTAAGLRAASALGLVRMNHPDALDEIVTLLVDREVDARMGAVRALACAGGLEAVPLLRLKVLAGERSADVLGECLGALLSLAPERSLAFVAGYLSANDQAVAEAAAMALGQSHLPAAVEMLQERYGAAASGSWRRTLLLALALARTDGAFEFLFSLVADGNQRSVAEALAALATYRHDERIRRRVQSSVAARSETTIEHAFRAEFGPDLPLKS